MSKSTIDSDALRLFADEEKPIPDEWFPPPIDLPENGAKALLLVFTEPMTAASNYVRVEFGTWRGSRVLSEQDAAQTDFPYPPEHDWKDE